MIESFRKRRWSIPALALVILVGTAIVIGVSNRAAEPNGAAPAGALGGFLSQTDGKFGYGMLRPAGWTSHDGSFARLYSDIPDGTRARLLLIVYNVGLAGVQIGIPMGSSSSGTPSDGTRPWKAGPAVWNGAGATTGCPSRSLRRYPTQRCTGGPSFLTARVPAWSRTPSMAVSH
jgi:hypothetical protein